HKSPGYTLDKEGAFSPGDEKPRLRLIAEARRAGRTDLLVRVALWNLTPEVQTVYPMDPLYYSLTFERRHKLLPAFDWRGGLAAVRRARAAWRFVFKSEL